ncbi:MAG: hypothetical protein ACYSU0_11995 [Planctomycetota bacterium]|jgi:hypothetical protein
MREVSGLSEADRARLKRILSCDVARQRRLSYVFFVAAPFFYLAATVIGLVRGAFVFYNVIALFSSMFLISMGLARLGYAKLFAIIQAVAATSSSGLGESGGNRETAADS